MLVACFSSAASGALAKGLMTGFPLAMVLLVRGGTALALILPFTPPAVFRAAPRRRLQFLRVGLYAVEVPLYFFSLFSLPIVDAMTYYLATPIYATAISALLMGERVGWRRWTAVLVGFAGVVIALRPSAAMLSWPALVALTGSLIYSVILVITRTLRGTDDRVLLIGQQAGVLFFAAIAASFDSVAMSLRDAALLAVLGVTTLFGSFCTNRSLKLAPASVVVPYQYSLLPWGALFGYLFFNETPQTTTLVGAAFIIGAGFYIFLREQALARQSLPANDPA